MDIIRYGAFIGYAGPTQFIIGEYMPSALNDRNSITKDIEKRTATSKILRLTTRPAKYIVWPLGLAPKQEGTWRRIHHLSSPREHSVNDYIPQAWGTHAYIRFDDAVAAVQACGPGAVLITRDLADAFRHIPVHTDDWWLLGFGWMGTWWCNQFLPFGCRTSPAFFDLFASALEWILPTQRGWEHTLHYLDDFLAIFPHSATPSDAPNRYSRVFSQICSNVGFWVKQEKNEEGQCIRFLGIEIDTEAMEAHLAHDQHEKATALVNSTLAQHSVTQRSLETTLGFMSFASKVVPVSHPFLRRLYDALTATSQAHHIRLSSELKKDLF
jgi:hypothetical protein